MKKYILLLVTLTVMGLSSCKEYLDINQDPSIPQTAEAFAILTPVIHQMTRGEQFDTRYIGKYIQNFAQSTASDVWDLHGYNTGSDNGGEKWRSHYWSIGLNIDLMIADAAPKEKWDYVGVAKAIRAWSWQSTTDYHGEMILKQAWEPNRYVFDFDSQEDVYAEVVRLCNDALKDLDRSDGAVSVASLKRGDNVYAGDRTKWTKFVYSVLARNALHLSNKATFNADKVIEYVDKSLASNADNFLVPFNGTSSADANFFGPIRGNMNNFRQTNFAVSLMDGTVFDKVVDPRIGILLTASPDGVYRGVTPGQGDPNNVNGNTKRVPTLWGVQLNEYVSTTTPGKYLYRDKATYPIVTYSEMQFVKAEAAFRKGDKALALTAYRNGISAHMDFAGVSAADKATYLASKAVKQTAADLTLSDIMMQKYISMYVHGAIETWVDMRRFKYSSDIYKGFTLPTTLFVDNGGKPAYRVRPRYNSEYVWNRTSLDKIGGNNNDYHTYEVWFVK
ncbi:MAG: SusD/RagB family nutrient-binding outer membrane lipoprotein [Spirosomataceae bacterium]